MRVYVTSPGGLVSLNENFAKTTIPLFNRHGIRSFGYWTEEIGTNNRLVYIVEFDDFRHREEAWASFRGDVDWQAHMRSLNQIGPPVVQRIYNTILVPTVYSPNSPKGGNGLVYELRQYDTDPGHIPALNERFSNVTLRLFETYGIYNIGYWTEDIGVSNRLDYILAYESLQQRQAAWAAFGQDPEWQETIRKCRELGRPIVNTVHNSILRPTDYSPLR